MALGQARDEQAASPTPAAHTCERGVPAAKFAQVLHALERIEARLDKLEAKMPTPPPTGASFVFTAPTTQSPRGSNLFPGLAASGTTQVDKSKQIPYVNLREKVALQNIALQKLQAKVDAQEQAQKEKIERLMQDITIVNNKKTLRSNTILEELLAKMDSREQALNEKIANLGAEVAHQNTLLANLDGCTLAHQKTVLQGLAGKVHSIQHGMCVHFESVVEALSAKVYKMEISWGNGSLKSVTCKQPMYCKSNCMCVQRPFEAKKVNTKMHECL